MKILTPQLKFPLLNFSLSYLLARFNGGIAIAKLLLREDEVYHRIGQIWIWVWLNRRKDYRGIRCLIFLAIFSSVNRILNNDEHMMKCCYLFVYKSEYSLCSCKKFV
ncbi:hypothetical protein CsatA_006320 [Cannabis sativa]